MTIREELKKRMKDGGSYEQIISDVMKSTGSGRDAVVRMYGKLGGVKHRPKTKTKSGRTLDEFKNTYDKNTYVPQKIQSALDELGESWEYESEFVQRAGINYTDMNVFREMFSDYFVFVRREGKKIWCGTRAMASKLKGLIQ